jgi:bifunctional non-homologous end joining protein LigD
MGLTKYKAKRDFSVTREPKGGKPLPKRVRGASRFVVQKHDASRLHYDFRLEMEGVLKSWAVPKGLPWKQGEKHLAVEVEDHPIEYASFEGVIPQANYGGGTVMVWDRGNYYVYGEEPLKSLRQGKLHLVLDGEKAAGEWTLIRMRGDDEKKQWLLLKSGADAGPISKKREDQSAKTGRSMKQIAHDRDAEWESNRKNESPMRNFRARIRLAVSGKSRSIKKKVPPTEGKTARDRSSLRKNNRSLLIALSSAKPRFIEPMKPRLLDDPPSSGDWIYELKFDGIRAIAVKDDRKVNLISRNRNELRARFPEIADAIKNLEVPECEVDGEAVAIDE